MGPEIGILYNFGLSVILILLMYFQSGTFQVERSLIFPLAIFLFLTMCTFTLITIFRIGDAGKMSVVMNYQFRFITLMLIFVLFTFIVAGLDETRLKGVLKFIIYLVILFSIIEILTRETPFKNIIDIFKARLPGSGMDSLHYSRLSGFFSFPGDWGLLIVASISFVPFIVRSVYFKIILTLVLLVLLFLTQSRAAMLTLFLYTFFVCAGRRPSITLVCVLSFALVILPYIQYLSGLDIYLLKNTNSLEAFLSSSKRISEYLDLNLKSLIFGLPSSEFQIFYETEIGGLVARLGLISLAPVVLLFFVIIKYYFSGSVFVRSQSAFLISYFFPYLFISAGISRPKLAILFLLLLTILFKYVILSRKSGKELLC